VNGLTPPKSGAAEWPPGPTPRASRGAPEPSDAFAGILNSQKARTATAEGQDRSPKTEGRNRRDDDGPVVNDRAQDRREADDVDTKRPVQHHEDDVQAKPADSADAPATTTPVAEVQVAVPEAQSALPQAATEVVTTAPVVPQPDVPQQPQVETPTQTQAQVASAPAPVAAPQAQAPDEKPVVQTPAQAAVAEATQQPAVETEGAAPAVQQQQPEAKPADDKPAQPGPVSVAKPKQAQSETSQQQNQSQQQGSLPQPAAEQARTVAQAYGRVAQHTSNEVPTTAQSGTPAASPVNQFTGGQPAAARGELAPATPVPLSRAAETIEHIMRLASNRGVTHARIALTPESLGSIDVHLRHTSDGVIARVMAHAPEAVHQLQQAAADLRQQLEGQGVNLLSLDIGHSAADEGSAASAGAGFGDEGRGDSRGRADGADATGDDAETTVNSTLQLPNGVLVDVLA
jgi:flagellar hook-length control protein FliK